MYLLVVSAEESDKFNIARFLVILQARAPGAVVQIVLTKTDKLKTSFFALKPSPELIMKKKEWILEEVQKFKDNNRNSENDHKSTPLNAIRMLRSVLMNL